MCKDRRKTALPSLNKTTGCCLVPLSAVTARTRRRFATRLGSLPPVGLPNKTEPLRRGPDSPESPKVVSLMQSLFDSLPLNLHCHLCFFPVYLLLSSCPLVPFWFCLSERWILRAAWTTSQCRPSLFGRMWLFCQYQRWPRCPSLTRSLIGCSECCASSDDWGYLKSYATRMRTSGP